MQKRGSLNQSEKLTNSQNPIKFSVFSPKTVILNHPQLYFQTVIIFNFTSNFNCVLTQHRKYERWGQRKSRIEEYWMVKEMLNQYQYEKIISVPYATVSLQQFPTPNIHVTKGRIPIHVDLSLFGNFMLQCSEIIVRRNMSFLSHITEAFGNSSLYCESILRM